MNDLVGEAAPLSEWIDRVVRAVAAESALLVGREDIHFLYTVGFGKDGDLLRLFSRCGSEYRDDLYI